MGWLIQMRFDFLRNTHISWWLPALALITYASQTHPLMWPGSDVWVHLMLIENSGRAWHDAWRFFASVFGIQDLLALINVIHVAQSAISFLLVYAASRLIFITLFYNSKISPHAINYYSWSALAIWVLMHGFHAGPVWASWFVIFANNYQIALPVYIFGIASIIYTGHLIATNADRFNVLFFGSLSVASVLFTAIIHAAELPYFILSISFLIIAFFDKRYLKLYFVTLLLFAAISIVSIEIFSYRKPAFYELLVNQSLTQALMTIQSTGSATLSGEYGYNTFNYWFLSSFLLLCVSFVFSYMHKGRSTQSKLMFFILLSSIPALMYSTAFGAGLLGMITYPDLAYRFTWSTFLFLAFPLAALYFTQRFSLPKFMMPALMVVCMASIPILSKFYEQDRVSYQYAISLIKALDSTKTFAGMSSTQQAWLDDAHEQLLQSNLSKPFCTDIFTAHYLYFQKRYQNVIIPRRYMISADLKHDRKLYDRCKFPMDGGFLHHEMGIKTGPWNYNPW